MGVQFDISLNIFDQTEELKAIRWGGVPLRSILQRAALFELDFTPTLEHFEAIGIHDYAETHRFLTDNFFLPFPEVIIEDSSGFVLACDMEDEQRGFAAHRRYITFRYSPQFEEMGLKKENAILITASGEEGSGSIIKPLDEPDEHGKRTSWLHKVSIEFGLMGDSESNRIFTGESKQLISPIASQDITCCLDEIIAINTPNRFVFEDRPSQIVGRSLRRKRHILQSSERPRYTMLTPGEIKRRFNPIESPAADENHHTKAPHYRRRHERHLTSNFWKNKQGATIVIPACWIGETERVMDGRRYSVILER